MTYKQRYFTYDGYWKPGGPFFFYTGNEASVDLYVNATGLIWENAKEFGAYIVFAEHRYYGESQPEASTEMRYLSHEQALADYATLIYDIKDRLKAYNSPVIVFGGSYGGKLAAWMRMKYPGTVQGAISGSAPILAFQGSHPEWKSERYYEIVTRRALIRTLTVTPTPTPTPTLTRTLTLTLMTRTATHYSKHCSGNVHAAIMGVEEAGATKEGRAMLGEAFSLCKQL